MKSFISTLGLAFFILFLNGCQKDSASPEDTELQVDAIVAEQAAFGWQANRTVLSTEEVASLTGNSGYLEQSGINNFSNLGKLKKRATRMQKESIQELRRIPGLTKPSADSLIFFFENNVTGIRRALYYDPATGLARYYEVKFKFAAWRNVTYDSSQIVADLNFTMSDDSDDKLVNLYQQQNFNANFFVQKIESQVTATDYDGTEISGAELTVESWYHSNRPLAHLRQSIDMNPDQSGTLREDFDFRDGSNAFNSVTFYPDNTGTFAKQLRDGTSVSGSFNSFEDDLNGSYHELIDFPSGRYIDTFEKNVSLWVTLPDTIINMDLSEIATFASGRVDSASAMITMQENDSVKTTIISQQKPNGAHGTFTVVESPDQTTMEGDWTSWDGYYILINAEYYIDESAHVHYEVYASQSAYDNGEDPLIVADYYFSPDESGNGTLTYGAENYELEFEAGGKATLRQQGKTKSINLF